MAEYRKDKYYWFKLKEDFFKRHDIKIIKSMPNGKDYVIFYLQLLCESLAHNGKLRFSDTIPYDDNMLSVITDTNIDIVRSAMKLFNELHIIEILDDSTIYMKTLQNMVGSTTVGAEKKQIQRKNNTNLIGVDKGVDKCPLEIEIEKEIDIDIDSKNECMNEYIEETNNTCVRASYEEIMQDFAVSKLVQLKLFEFIKHLKLHNVVMINSRLESIIVGLDMKYREDVDRIACIDRAIVSGHKKLEFE